MNPPIKRRRGREDAIPNITVGPEHSMAPNDGTSPYERASPRFGPDSPALETVNAPRYFTDSPSYNPNSPSYSPSRPARKPDSPSYSPSSPARKPDSPSYSPSSPAYNPDSPRYSTSSPARKPHSSPAYDPDHTSYSREPPISPARKPDSPSYSPSSPARKPPSSPAYNPNSPPRKPESSTHNGSLESETSILQASEKSALSLSKSEPAEDEDDKLPLKLFTPTISQEIINLIKGSAHFRHIQQQWGQENESQLDVLSRDMLELSARDLDTIVRRIINQGVCDELNQNYIRSHVKSALYDQKDDLFAIVSDDQHGDVEVQAFLVAELKRTSEPNEAVWALSLICSANLSGMGLLLVQSFLYAVKCYCAEYGTHQVVVLDLARGFDNESALGTYSRVGFTSFGNDKVAAIVAQQNKYRHAMSLDLKDQELHQLRSNIGTLPDPQPSPDYLLSRLTKAASIFKDKVLDLKYALANSLKNPVDDRLERSLPTVKQMEDLLKLVINDLPSKTSV